MSVCCRGWSACYGTESIDIVGNKMARPAVLSGYGAASGVGKGGISVIDGQDIFCTGDSSCYGANMTVGIHGGGTVYCLGELSCAYATIYNARVICGAQNSCF